MADALRFAGDYSETPAVVLIHYAYILIINASAQRDFYLPCC